MATKIRTEQAESSAKPKKGSRSLVSVLLAAVLTVAVFYLGAQYYTARRSITVAAVATGFTKEAVTLYRPPSGVLDKYSPDDPYSLTVSIPMAPSFTLRTSEGKFVKSTEYSVGPGSERAVSVTINPQGKVCRIQDLGEFFSIRGTALVKDKTEMEVGGKTYFVGDTLFLSSGALTGKSGDSLEGAVETGDTVKILGYGDRSLVVDVIERAGRLSVTSNVESSRVYIDGVLRGKTPIVVSCAPGTREILIRADGYKDHKASVNVASMEQAEYTASLEPVTGTLNLTSTPPGASVYVGSEMKGKTPVKVAVPPGRYEVRFELDGYYAKTVETVVTAGYERPVDASLARMPGVPGGAPGSASGDSSREVTVVSADPPSMTFVGLYPAGYKDTFRLTGSTKVDGWPASQSTVEKLIPGEKVRLTLNPDGTVASMSKTYSHRFVMKEKVQSKSGASLFLGPGWVKCSLAWDAVVEDKDGVRLTRGVTPGDTVTVYGASADDIRYVRVEETVGETWQREGHLVSTPAGLRVFGDSYIISMDIPDGLRVADPENRTTVSVSQVPSGSRVRFYMSPTLETVWAELVWRANVSLSGSISSQDGDVIKVAPLWDDLSVNPAAVIYEGSSRAGYFTLTVGDLVLAAGPSTKDIRFVWVQDKALYSRVIDAVVVSTSGRQERAFREITPEGLGKHDIYVGAQTTFGHPAAKRTIRASELEAGDRVKLWLDEQKQVIWGEVTEKTDTKASGVYLGVSGGFTYLSGLQRFTVRSDMIITGLSSGETPEPGSTVQVAGVGNMLTYMEVKTDLKKDRNFKGKVLSSKDLLRIRGNWLYEEFEFGKDVRFVDWELMRDGPVTELFPGDEVDVSVDISDEAIFVERTYSPPFKFEGTIKSRHGRTIVITDKTETKTIEVTSKALIYKDGVKGDLFDLREGDKVKASGEDKNMVDIVVSGW